MATWRHHTLECKPVLFYMLRLTWERRYIRCHLWFQLWIAEGHIRKTCWITGRLAGPTRGKITFCACQAGGLGTDRAQMQTLMLQLTHYLLHHTFFPYKPEDGVTTTGGELVLNSFLSLMLTFWWVKLRSMSHQGVHQTLQCRHFLHRACKELLTSILALVQAPWGAHCRCQMHCFLRLLSNTFSKWTGVTQAL